MTTKTAAVAYDVRWRVAGADVAWSTPQRFKVNAELVINGLTGGKTYNTQARSISNCGAMSAWADQDDLVVPTVKQRLSQGHLNMLRVGGIGSAWTGFSISYSATTTSATISCTAGTLQDGDSNPAYGASSATVSGTAGTTVVYYLYYDDPTGSGGNLALGTTTSYSDLSANQGRINVGSASVTFPASGTGTGGGTPGGGCVVIEAWVYARRNGRPRWMRAGKVRVGDELWLPRLKRWGVVTYSQRKLCESVRIDTAHDVQLSCSTSAPIGVSNGPDVLAPAVLGLALPSVIDSANVDDSVTAVTPLGLRWVQHITCEHSHFLAGDRKGRGLHHHNLKQAQ